MITIQQIRADKISNLECDLIESEALCDRVNKSLEIYKQLIAEHDWATEMITMFDCFYQELETKHGLSMEFVKLDKKKQEISMKLQQFKSKLEGAFSVIREFLPKLKAHFALLKELRIKVDQETDFLRLNNLRMPLLAWIRTIPDFELEEMTTPWKEMNIHSLLSQVLLELRLLSNGVNTAE